MRVVLAQSLGQLFIRGPLSFLPRIFTKHITAYCSKCKDNRLDLIFRLCTDPTTKLCRDCLLHARLFIFFYDYIFRSWQLERKAALSFLGDKRYSRVMKNLIKGMARFGIAAPHVAGAPIAVVWNFTNKCNLRCGHCYTNAPASPDDWELSTRECFRVIDRLVAADVSDLNLTGGEPLVREDFFEVAGYAREKGLHVTLASNGILLTRENVLRLKDIGVSSICISLDGAVAKTHERIRGQKGCFDQTITGIQNAVRYGDFSEVIVNTTLTKFTLDEIPRVYELVKDLGVNKYYVSRILPTGRGESFTKYDVSPEEKIRVLTFLYEKFKDMADGKDEIPTLARGMTYFAKVCFERSRGSFVPVCEVLTGFEESHQKSLGWNMPIVVNQLRAFFSGCATGLFYCGISPQGQVLPCAPAADITLGSLLEQDLETIWLNHPTFRALRQRSQITGKCSQCSGKAYCGGCRLTAFRDSGDWLAADRSCPY